MKATLIFATLILFTALMGCSDNLGVNETFNQDYNTGSNSHSTNNGGDFELIWHLEQLSVRTSSESWVENKAVYTLPPTVPPILESGTYLITFDGYTNAGRFSNGYEAFAEVSWENQSNGALGTVFEGAGTDGINGYKEIRLSKTIFSDMKFYIALFQVDGPSHSNETTREPSNVTSLKLSNIKIFRGN